MRTDDSPIWMAAGHNLQAWPCPGHRLGWPQRRQSLPSCPPWWLRLDLVILSSLQFSRPYSAPITLLAPSRPDTGDSGGEGVPGPRREANSRQPAWVNLPREGRRGSWGMQAGGPGECISLTLDTGLKCRAAGTVRWRRWGQTWIGGGRRQSDLTVEQSPECPGLHWLSHTCLGIRTNSAWPCSLIRAAGP